MLTKTIIENILIISSEGFWILSNWSQLRKLIKTSNRRGLNAVNQTLNAAGNIAWITYFAHQRLFVPVATNATMFLLTAATLAYTLGNRKQFNRGILAIAILGPLTNYIIVAHASISGWIGVIYNEVAVLPWVANIILTHKTSGLSERGLFFAIGAMTCTFTYGLLISSVQLIAGTLAGMLNTLIVMTYYYRYRRTN